MDEETKSTILFYWYLVLGLSLIGMTIYTIGMMIYTLILHPVEAILVLGLSIGVILGMWFLVEYIFADLIAGLIAGLLAPYFAAIVMDAMPEEQQEE